MPTPPQKCNVLQRIERFEDALRPPSKFALLSRRISQLATVLSGKFPDGLSIYDPSLLRQPTGKLKGWMYHYDVGSMSGEQVQSVLQTSRVVDIMSEPVDPARRCSLCIVEPQNAGQVHIYIFTFTLSILLHVIDIQYHVSRRTVRNCTIRLRMLPTCARNPASLLSLQGTALSRPSRRRRQL
jgi:hypothetical protein